MKIKTEIQACTGTVTKVGTTVKAETKPQKYLRIGALLMVAFGYNSLVFAQKAKQLTVGGYIDGYYAYDLGSPASIDRSYTTQSVRDNEFNINLAFLDLSYETPKTRSRLALQAGTSVQHNYLSEPRQGTISGGELTRHLQEARIGYRLSEETWLDAGIFFSHLGPEGWIARDNINLSRSLLADYTPYYFSGVRVSHVFTKELKAQVLIVNGWQNVSENNSDKSLGGSISYDFPMFNVAYNGLIGQEKSPDLSNQTRNVSRLRHYHDFIVRSRESGPIEWIAQLDVGFQRKQTDSGDASWWGTSLTGRWRLDERTRFPVRIEYFNDKDQVVMVNPRSLNSETFGLSVGFDRDLDTNLVWRSELRHLESPQDIFPDKQTLRQNNTVIMTSLALTL